MGKYGHTATKTSEQMKISRLAGGKEMAEEVKHTRTYLTFEEKIIVAWAYYVRGITQQDLAALFNINQGRISEACKAVERALDELEEPNGP
jgi:DNA-binding MarR family transcriptional regulator